MYRRIELINHFPGGSDKSGLLGLSTDEVVEAWVHDLKAPMNLYKNCRFYFTELGWEKIGRKVVQAAGQSGQDYRVIRIKESSVDVFWRDEYQVAVRARKKRRRKRKE